MTNSAAPISAPAEHKTFWAWTVATFFGAGFGKPGPGTWGSVAAVLLWAGYAWGVSSSPHALLIALLVGIALSLVLGIPAATIAARESGREDPGFVVVDEVAGQWIAVMRCWLWFCSASSTSPSPFLSADWNICPRAGASFWMMWARGCMLCW
jgi:phosphatidylglycerophosphatase A